MRKEIVVVAVIAAGAFAYAQEPAGRGDAAAVDKRLGTLEQRVAVLEQQNADLRRFITTSGNSMTIRANENLSVEVGRQLGLRASAGISIDSAADTRLKGSRVIVNGGTKPVARVGDRSVPASNGNYVLQEGSATLLTD